MSGRLLIENGWVVTGDPALGTVAGCDVLVEDGLISAVGPGLRGRAEPEVIDAGGMLVFPGLVDTHKHTWQSAVRHRCAELDLPAYFGEMFGRLGPLYRPEDVYAGNLLGALSAIDAGTTTLMDWSHVQNSPEHGERAVAALRDSGIRAVFGHGWPLVDLPAWISGSDRPHTGDVRRIRRELLPDDDGLVTLHLAGRGPELSTLAATRADLAMARDLGIRVSIHMGCGREFGAMAAIAQMERAGLLGPDLNFVHCGESSDDEFAMIADSGGTVALAPQHEQALPGIGHTPIDRVRAFAITAGLSTDTETAGAADLFTQMRAALAAHRNQLAEGRSRFADRVGPFTVAEVFAMATQGGADTLGLGDRVGSLTPGKRADVILVRAGDPNLFPVTDPVAALVTAAHPGNVDTVLVDGVVRKRAGALTGDRYDRARELALASQRRLLG
ncbi:amidohydrolase family protein [Actinomadura sp. NEAU-AAG7]|uniref:amidohydrolase family protein n=1 Tax=Actinomadura sp. NEAU-AAG7 TaxID=2839640 RepID=UPI001BE42229|nr:amidohydrolase family protein [Actinomadura sp. NEAU-AAG7]MBT2208791.1 amidohydrolase family protein [Actinomadura sp. NEAU-AAG7]